MEVAALRVENSMLVQQLAVYSLFFFLYNVSRHFFFAMTNSFPPFFFTFTLCSRIILRFLFLSHIDGKAMSDSPHIAMDFNHQVILTSR